MDEMRMAKFETLIEDVDDAIRRGDFWYGTGVFTGESRFIRELHRNKTSPLYLIFESDKINEFASVICENAIIKIKGDDFLKEPWADNYGIDSLSDAKTKIEASKDFVKYCRNEVNRPEGYKFIFWALMIVSVTSDVSDDSLSLICDFARMLRITDDELLDITYAIKCIYNEVKEDYVFKSESVPAVLGNLFSLYGNSDFTIE